MGLEGRPPARIATERLVLRTYDPGDAEALKQAIDASLEHLRPFMDWAWEPPEPIETVRARLQMFAEWFERGDDFVYGLFSADESEVVGGAGLHRRLGPRTLEIGYWIRAGHLRKGLATEASAALTRIAFECCGVDHVEIRVDPANMASLGVPAKLGYRLDRTLEAELAPVRIGDPRRDAAVFVMGAADFAASPAATRLRPKLE